MAYVLTLQSGIPVMQSIAVGTAPYDSYETLASNITSGNTYTLQGSKTYTPGQKEIQVFIDGIAQTSGLDYTESSTTQITLNKNVNTGQTIRIRI